MASAFSKFFWILVKQEINLFLLPQDQCAFNLLIVATVIIKALACLLIFTGVMNVIREQKESITLF